MLSSPFRSTSSGSNNQRTLSPDPTSSNTFPRNRTLSSTSNTSTYRSKSRERERLEPGDLTPPLGTNTRHTLSRQASMLNLQLTPGIGGGNHNGGGGGGGGGGGRNFSGASSNSSGYGGESSHGNGNGNGHAGGAGLGVGLSNGYNGDHHNTQNGGYYGSGGGTIGLSSVSSSYTNLTGLPSHSSHHPNSGPGSGLSLPLSLPSLSIANDRAAFLKRYATARGKKAIMYGLRFSWIVIVIWCEVGEFFHSISNCSWPDAILVAPTSSSSSSSRKPPNPSSPITPTHVLLLTDPQIPHPTLSYPSSFSTIHRYISLLLSDLYLRKSWNTALRLGRIDEVIIAGNMLDWGRGAFGEEEYEGYVKRFKRMFSVKKSAMRRLHEEGNGNTSATTNGIGMGNGIGGTEGMVGVHTVPGNLDVGLGPNRMFSPFAKERYARHFSPPNTLLPIAGHTFVLLDSISLVEEDYRRYAAEVQLGEWDGVRGGVIEFVKNLGEDPPSGPTILISHIPLARPEQSTCGPRREKGRIYKGAGIGYQNLLGSETTRFLLDNLQPSVIFSGDDHDYCEYVHPNGVREVTLKTFSNRFEVHRPGFQLLSLMPPEDGVLSYERPTHADSLCLLPDQAAIYTRRYIPFWILTMVFLFYLNARIAMNKEKTHGARAKTSPSNSRKNSLAPGDRTPSAVSRPMSRTNSNLAPLMVTRRMVSASAPTTPLGSPKMESFSIPNPSEDDLENGYGGQHQDGLYISTPGVRSRTVSQQQSSHGKERGSFTEEPNSYFLPIPDNGSYGLGIGTPGGLLTPGGRRPSRRITRAPSEWQSAARAKEMTVVELMWDSGQVEAKRWFGMSQMRGVGQFMGGRRGILATTMRDMVGLAAPSILAWFIINGIYFL